MRFGGTDHRSAWAGTDGAQRRQGQPFGLVRYSAVSWTVAGLLRLAMQAHTKADDKTREKEMERKAASCCVWMISAGGGSTSGWGTCSVVRINMTVVIGRSVQATHGGRLNASWVRKAHEMCDGGVDGRRRSRLAETTEREAVVAVVAGDSNNNSKR